MLFCVKLNFFTDLEYEEVEVYIYVKVNLVRKQKMHTIHSLRILSEHSHA